jgi:hypothetical protein
MTYWFTGEEEHSDPRFTTHSLGLYTRAGSWCMSQIRYRPEAEIPAVWFVPEWVVKGWGNTRQANDLVANEVWEPVAGGWHYAWIRWRNTAEAVRRERKRERDKWARKQAKASLPKQATPQGSYKGESPGEPEQTPKSRAERQNDWTGDDQRLSPQLPWGLPWGHTRGRYGYVA